jgi:hypothetical protein
VARKRTTEILVIRGVVDAAGQFCPRRCYSTHHVRQWPESSYGWAIELLDGDDKVINRGVVSIHPMETCELKAALESRVRACIALRHDAASVRLRHGDLLLWSRAITPVPAFTLKLSAPGPTRARAATLTMRFPEHADAYIRVIYEWKPSKFQEVYSGPPRKLLRVPVASLPGGTRCRFVVLFCDGLRATGKSTTRFAVPPARPSVRIVSPTPNARLMPGEPLTLEAEVVDPEAPGRVAGTALSWFLDNTPIGSGHVAGLLNPPPGTHVVRLVYRSAKNVIATVTFTVRRWQKGMPVPADAWSESRVGRG